MTKLTSDYFSSQQIGWTPCALERGITPTQSRCAHLGPVKLSVGRYKASVCAVRWNLRWLASSSRSRIWRRCVGGPWE
jgi:hypothetical protein